MIKILKGAFKKMDTTLRCKMRPKGGLVSPKKGLGGSTKKKKNVEKEDYDQESDFVEQIVREHIKNRGGSKGKGKGYHYERASPHSDDEPLAQCLERKRKSVWQQDNKNVNKMNEDSDYADDGE